MLLLFTSYPKICGIPIKKVLYIILELHSFVIGLAQSFLNSSKSVKAENPVAQIQNNTKLISHS